MAKVEKIKRKIRLMEGNVPVLSVVDEVLPFSWERAMKMLWDLGVDVRSDSDKRTDDNKFKYRPGRDATMMITVCQPELLIHKEFKEQLFGVTTLKLNEYPVNEYIDCMANNISNMFNIRRGLRKISYIHTTMNKIKIHMRLCIDEESRFVLNFNVDRNEINLYKEWYIQAYALISLQKKVAEAVAKEIKEIVIPGRYTDIIHSCYITGKDMDDHYMKIVNDMKIKPNNHERVVAL